MPQLPGGDRRAGRSVRGTARPPVGPPARPRSRPARHEDDLAAYVRSDVDSLPQLRSDLAAARLEEHIRRVVDAAPPLTADHRGRLALLLLPGAGDGA